MMAKLVASTADSLCSSGAAKILPRLFQIAQFARENVNPRALLDRFLPGKRHLPVGVPIQKREGLDHDGNRGVQPSAGPLQQVPLLARLPVQRVARQSQCDPSAAVDEDRLALPHQSSS